MKPGWKTSEFWFGFLLAVGLFLLIWFKRYPAFGDPGYDGISWLITIWGAYMGAQKIVKWNNPLADSGATTAATKKTSETTVTETVTPKNETKPNPVSPASDAP